MPSWPPRSESNKDLIIKRSEPTGALLFKIVRLIRPFPFKERRRERAKEALKQPPYGGACDGSCCRSCPMALFNAPLDSFNSDTASDSEDQPSAECLSLARERELIDTARRKIKIRASQHPAEKLRAEKAAIARRSERLRNDLRGRR